MRTGTAVLAALTLALAAAPAGAEDDAAVHGRFRATLNKVFGAGNWRVTGGYRTPERENELRRQGALTVPIGTMSRHSAGHPDAPGAYDVVVPGLSPWQAAAKLRAAGAPFRTIFAEGAYGSQGAHLHIDPYAGAAGGRRGPVTRWVVANLTPEQIAANEIYYEATQGNPDAQLELGHAYAEGRGETRDLIAARVWTAMAAANPDGEPELRAAAERFLGELDRRLKPDQIAYARKFAPQGCAALADGPTMVVMAGFDPPAAAPACRKGAEPATIGEDQELGGSQ